jgi:hypothetical protein
MEWELIEPSYVEGDWTEGCISVTVGCGEQRYIQSGIFIVPANAQLK